MSSIYFYESFLLFFKFLKSLIFICIIFVLLILLKEKAEEMNEKGVIENVDNGESVCEYEIDKGDGDYNKMNKCEKIDILAKSRSNYKFLSND